MVVTRVKRRQVLRGMALGSGAVAMSSIVGSGTAESAPASGYLVGAGKGDLTGSIAGQGMMGYSELDQIATGLLQRTWARAYIIADAATGKRVVFCNVDLAVLFESHRVGVMQALRMKFGDLYSERNVNLNATHNHNSCGGTAWDYAYTLAALGFKKNSYDAEVSAMVAAIERAHASLAPGTVEIGHSQLFNASANRSIQAFLLNPEPDKLVFPQHIDPQVTVLRLRQGSKDIGVITWFSTHGTSLTDANTLIAADNKGYASYRAETEHPGQVWAFPQTNAGDMTPNLWVRPFNPGGPTSDHRANCAIIGERQYRAGCAALADAKAMTTGGVDYAYRYVNMADTAIDGSYTPDGKPKRTTPAMMGAAAAATSSEDNVKTQLPFLYEGQVNPLAAALGATTISPPPPWVNDMQAPKLILFPLGLMPPQPWIPQILPIQIIRIGDLVLAAGPAEYTIVAGLRIRQIVAHALSVPLQNVLLQGYSNAYSQYVTTPEEYVAQQYEGGETQFGRYTLSAYMQEFDRLARSMASGSPLDLGPLPPDRSRQQPDLVPPPPPDVPVAGRRLGDVLTQPRDVHAGSVVKAVFVGAHPNNNFHTDTTYFEVQRAASAGWEPTFDDNDWCTELHWARPDGQPAASLITILWTPPMGTTGRFRIVYYGDAKAPSGQITAFTAMTNAFTVG